MSTDNLPPPFKLNELKAKPHRRLQELERRLSGSGIAQALGAVGPAELHGSTHFDFAVASGAFPAPPSTPTVFTPTRPIAFGIGFMTVQVAYNNGLVGSTSDFGCNINRDTGGGFGAFPICSLGNTRLYNDATTSGALDITSHGFQGPIEAGQPIRFRHEYYNPDIYVAGAVAMASAFTFVAFVAEE